MRVASGLAALCVIGWVAGCGSAVVWDRYRAEREAWKATRLLERIERDPGAASEAEYRRAAAAFRRAVEQFPPSRWAAPGQPGYAREVAVLSGRAANALARLDHLRGRDREAAEAYARVFHDYRAVPPVALDAAVGRSEALERCAGKRAAAQACLDVALGFPLVDPERGTPLAPVLDAPQRAARLFAELGDRAAAERGLREAVARYETVLPKWTGKEAAPELWLRLSEVRGALGEFDASLAALRNALREPLIGARRAPVLLDLADRSLGAGRPDSALAYAAWAEHDFTGESQGRAIMLSALAWEGVGRPDSALGAYQRFLDGFPHSADSTALARYRRGGLLERIGRWEEARSEYRVLAATYPSHEFGFAALVHIARHHAERGERKLADIEGRRALDTVEQVIATYRDDGVQVLARRARGELLLILEAPETGFGVLAQVWKSFPGSPRAAEAGLRAAQIAESTLRDSKRAAELYRELAAQSVNREIQLQARAGFERVRRGQS